MGPDVVEKDTTGRASQGGLGRREPLPSRRVWGKHTRSDSPAAFCLIPFPSFFHSCSLGILSDILLVNYCSRGCGVFGCFCSVRGVSALVYPASPRDSPDLPIVERTMHPWENLGEPPSGALEHWRALAPKSPCSFVDEPGIMDIAVPSSQISVEAG